VIADFGVLLLIHLALQLRERHLGFGQFLGRPLETTLAAGQPVGAA
jgi:hypothetical protein